MKTRKSILSLILAIVMLTGSALATEATKVQSAPTPTAISLDNASGNVLAAAQVDLAEARSKTASCSTPQLFNSDDVMIYDYGTRSVGNYEVSTTLYTFDENVSRASGQVGGISVHTYTQNGIVRFKVYFMMLFSYDGSVVTPMVSEADTWSSSDEATLSITNTSYTTGTSSTYKWTYSVTYGTTTVSNKKATVSCTNKGVVTYEEESYVFPAE